MGPLILHVAVRLRDTSSVALSLTCPSDKAKAVGPVLWRATELTPCVQDPSLTTIQGREWAKNTIKITDPLLNP